MRLQAAVNDQVASGQETPMMLLNTAHALCFCQHFRGIHGGTKVIREDFALAAGYFSCTF